MRKIQTMENIIDLLNSAENSLQEVEKSIKQSMLLGLVEEKKRAKKLLDKYNELQKSIKEKRASILEILTPLLIVSGNLNFFLPTAGFRLHIVTENQFIVSNGSGPHAKDNGTYTYEKLANWIYSSNFETFCNEAMAHITKDLFRKMKMVQENSETNSLTAKKLIEISDKIKGILAEA